MPIAAAGPLLTEAARRRTAIAAFNVITLEHIEAVIAGAEAAGAPVIVQISENAVRFRHGRLLPLARAALAAAEQSTVGVALHLDHVRDTALLRQAAEAGCGSVMYDAAGLPHRENAAATRDAADWAHRNGLWIEAELGQIGGKPGAPALDPHAPGARTDPGQARAFVAGTGVDALAVAIGSTHAMTTRTARLDHRLLAALAAEVPVPLVLHGASGVPDAELSAAVAGGITKVNIGTALNAALTAETRARLTGDTAVTDPRIWLAPGREAMTAAVRRLIAVVHRPAADAPAEAPGSAAVPTETAAQAQAHAHAQARGARDA
jgi:fructose-bisphosphate aldolase class II